METEIEMEEEIIEIAEAQEPEDCQCICHKNVLADLWPRPVVPEP